MSLKYVVTYKVTGFGEFPWDMLRYDRSSPYSEAGDSYRMSRVNGDERTIKLVTYVESPSVVKKGFCPCRQRWDSFGWSVSEITVEKMR
jgi:hypothetical protein